MTHASRTIIILSSLAKTQKRTVLGRPERTCLEFYRSSLTPKITGLFKQFVGTGEVLGVGTIYVLKLLRFE